MSTTTQWPHFNRVRLPSLGRIDARKLLLLCGVVFPLLWVALDVASSLLYDGYSYKDPTVSELSAYDAPTRTLWLLFGTLGGLLTLAFAAGVWQSAGDKRALRVVAVLLGALSVANFVLSPFSSMHQREVLAADGGNFSDTLHLTLVGVGGIVFMLEAIFASFALGTRFRIYSAATLLITLICGFVTSLSAADVQANEPTPWVGIIERGSAYSYELWIVVFALALLTHIDSVAAPAGAKAP